MLTYPDIDPVAFAIGPLKIHWYGLSYLFGFAVFWFLGRWRAVHYASRVRPEMVDDLLFFGALGVILGGRIGYILFYNFTAFVANPLILFEVWQGGMSFHGGLLGVLLGIWWFARKHAIPFWVTTDFMVPLVPVGLGSGRLGNFVNGELWGRVSDVPWAMLFPGGGPLPRHPSQLYQFALEGVVLFIVVWVFSHRPRPMMSVSALFLACYGLFRFMVEFVREPDAHIGYVAFGWLTMGQLLSLPMIIIGVTLFIYAYHRHRG